MNDKILIKLFILEHSKHFSNFQTPFTSFEVLNNIHESTFFSKAFPEVASKHSKTGSKNNSGTQNGDEGGIRWNKFVTDCQIVTMKQSGMVTGNAKVT